MAFYPLEKLINLQEGYKKAFQIDGKKLLLIQHNERTWLIENACPHMGVALTNATLCPDNIIRCKAHGIEFALDTGKSLGPLANTLDCLTKYSIIYEGNQVGVDLPVEHQ